MRHATGELQYVLHCPRAWIFGDRGTRSRSRSTPSASEPESFIQYSSTPQSRQERYAHQPSKREDDFLPPVCKTNMPTISLIEEDAPADQQMTDYLADLALGLTESQQLRKGMVKLVLSAVAMAVHQ